MKHCHLLPFDILVKAAEGGPLLPADAWHLGVCEGCRDAVALLHDQAEALRRLITARADLELRERILRRARCAAREGLIGALRSLLRQAARREARSGRRAQADTRRVRRSSHPATGAPRATAWAGDGLLRELLFEIATLQRRLALLGESLDLDGLASATPNSPDLARRTLELLVRLEGLALWQRRSGALPFTHQPAASPSLRDSLAPR